MSSAIPRDARRGAVNVRRGGTSAEPPSGPEEGRPEGIDAIPVRRPTRAVMFVVSLILLAMLINTLFTNERFQWDVVGEYFLSPRILDGLRMTLQLTVLAMLLGSVIGVALAVMRQSDAWLASKLASLYILFFRGTPLLVQLIFWFNIAALYPELSFGIPFGPEFGTIEINRFVTPYVAALLGLSLNEGAYMSEIVRGGIESIDRGQHHAAKALGMSSGQTMRRIILPQAMRVIIPPTGNELIAMLKYTSLVSVISLGDLLYSAQIIYSRTYQTMPMLIVVSLWYLIITTILMVIQSRIEKRYSRGF